MSLGLTRPPLADSTMLTLTSHYTATNAKHHRYAAPNLPRRPRGKRTAHAPDPGERGAGGTATDAGSTAGQPEPRAEPWTVRDAGRALTVRDASGVLDRPRYERSPGPSVTQAEFLLARGTSGVLTRPRHERRTQKIRARGTEPRVSQATSGPRATWDTEILPLPTSIPGTEHGWETSHLVRMTPSRTTARVRALSPATRRERTDACQTPPIAHPAGRQERWQRPGQ